MKNKAGTTCLSPLFLFAVGRGLTAVITWSGSSTLVFTRTCGISDCRVPNLRLCEFKFDSFRWDICRCTPFPHLSEWLSNNTQATTVDGYSTTCKPARWGASIFTGKSRIKKIVALVNGAAVKNRIQTRKDPIVRSLQKEEKNSTVKSQMSACQGMNDRHHLVAP